jgi:hypothetical protein
MKRTILLLTLPFLLFCSPSPAIPQFSVQYEKAFKAQRLSGTIRAGCSGCLRGASLDETSSVVNGVLVEEMTPDWKAVVSSTRTDVNGHFLFPTPADKNLHFLRLSAYGLRTTYVKVRISRWARKRELTLFLSIAT